MHDRARGRRRRLIFQLMACFRQPSLPFAAALHAFEAELIEEKEKEKVTQREHEVQRELELGASGLCRANRLTWSALAHEISSLNAKFLPS